MVDVSKTLALLIVKPVPALITTEFIPITPPTPLFVTNTLESAVMAVYAIVRVFQ